jgi:hypothetical protein
VTSDDYVKVFRQSATYMVYLNGGRCIKGFSKDKLKLRQVSQFGDLSKLAYAIIKYTSVPSFTNKILHLEGQEVFGPTKQRVDITLGLDGDSHKHDCVNFSQLRINAMSSGFIGSNVGVGVSSGIVRDEPFVLTFQGLKVQKCVCEDGV